MNTEAEFKNELKELLRKYNVEMSIESDRDGDAEINFFRYNTSLRRIDIDWNTRYMNGDSK
jgi:hypothetical protein